MHYAPFLLFALGLGLLAAGAESLVRGASRLAVALGVSPLVIGLTVVAFGTSSPELAVSIRSGLIGQADIALGNVVGSNIFNVLFILGVSAMITPLSISRQLIRLDVPVMIGVSVLPLLLGLDGRIGRFEGLLLFGGIVAYTAFLIYQSSKSSPSPIPLPQGEGGTRWFINGIFIAGGLVLLVVGSRWLVDGAVAIARTIGISELVIGLTIVAAGTSLPEAATSVIAASRGERDIAVGNIVGSNIFNILSVLGLSAVVAPEGISVSPAALIFDIPVMIAVAVACLLVFLTGHLMARWEGALFFGYYLAYTAYLILDAMQHEILPLFTMALAIFVMPATGLFLLIMVIRTIRQRGFKH